MEGFFRDPSRAFTIRQAETQVVAINAHNSQINNLHFDRPADRARVLEPQRAGQDVLPFSILPATLRVATSMLVSTE
jgi:hypothetical protein